MVLTATRVGAWRDTRPDAASSTSTVEQEPGVRLFPQPRPATPMSSDPASHVVRLRIVRILVLPADDSEAPCSAVVPRARKGTAQSRSPRRHSLAWCGSHATRRHQWWDGAPHPPASSVRTGSSFRKASGEAAEALGACPLIAVEGWLRLQHSCLGTALGTDVHRAGVLIFDFPEEAEAQQFTREPEATERLAKCRTQANSGLPSTRRPERVGSEPAEPERVDVRLR